MKVWELEDIEVANRNSTDKFFIPLLEERCNQKIGDQVRLHFLINNPKQDEPRAERMWVEITKVTKFLGSLKYAGVLTNQPAFISGLNLGDRIEFSPKHIAQTIIKKDSPFWIDSAEKKALVSKMCLEKDCNIRFLYREKPDRDEDSGWRMFSGLEDDDYTNDISNIRIMNVGYLLDIDPSLLEPLKGGYGCAYERENKESQWIKVENWEPSE